MKQQDAFDLGDFLAQQSSEGQVESQGQFTVSQEKAQAKLARFALPFDYAWVLKVVQSAVAWEAPEIRVRQYRTFTAIEFCPSDLADIPREERLVAALLSGKVGGQEPLEMFCQGLRALVEQAGLSFRLTTDEDPQAARPIQAGKDACALEREGRLHRLEPMAGVRLMIAHLPLGQFFLARYTPKQLLNDRPDRFIAQALERYCFLSPIPIILDGRRIDRLLADRKWGFSRDRRPLLLSGLRREGLPLLPVPQDFEQKIFSVRTHPRRAQRPYGTSREFSSWIYVRTIPVQRLRDTGISPPAPTNRHSIFYVCHGVVVEHLRTNFDCKVLEVNLILNAQGLPTDLSGLSLIETDPSREELRAQIKEAVDHFQEIASEPEVFLRDDLDEQSESDGVDFRLAAESHQKVNAALESTSDEVRKVVAAVVFLGKRLLTSESDPAAVTDDMAKHWLVDLKDDLESVEALSQLRIHRLDWN